MKERLEKVSGDLLALANENPVNLKLHETEIGAVEVWVRKLKDALADFDEGKLVGSAYPGSREPKAAKARRAAARLKSVNR